MSNLSDAEYPELETDSTDSYEALDQRFNPLYADRKARRKRKPQANPPPKPAERDVRAELTDSASSENDFRTTYQPSRYEAGWLLSSLRSFYDQFMIVDIQAVVKGGKEASVYRCEAHPRLNTALVAAKVYRPRMFRSLSNDLMYREGREILTTEGRVVKKSDQRIMRAVGKKTAYGQEVAHTSWLMYEYTTLERLYAAGAAVPQPFAVNENSILMSYVGDEQIAAPPLSEIRLEPDEARPLFDEVMRNIEVMLQHDMIHGDLSAYNILYWEGKITLIDFPQVTNSQKNRSAMFILQRDVERICEYFARQGVRRNPATILERLTQRYMQNRQVDLDDTDYAEA